MWVVRPRLRPWWPAQPGAEADDRLDEGGADDGGVQGVFVEGAAHARKGGQGAEDDGAGVDAAGTVGGQAAGLPAQQALDRGGRECGEQAHRP